MPRITSKDVAREAGVSQTTVSFVLNGRDEYGISEGTRRLVLDTAQRLGYVPSAAASSLRAGRSSVVVCLLPDLPVTEAMEVLKRQFSAALGGAGYTCVFLELTGSPRSLSEVWRHISPAAVVAFGSLLAADATALRGAEIPVLDDVLHPDEFKLEGLDQHDIGKLQVQHLAERGHATLGFAGIEDPREAPFWHPRLEGARQACRDLGLPEPLLATMSYSKESARAALAVWSKADTPVTAVAAFNDLTALAVLAACHGEGARVPDDLAVVGVDDLAAAALAVPALSTISMDLSIPGRKLAERVIGMIEGSEPAFEGDDGRVLRLVHRQSS